MCRIIRDADKEIVSVLAPNGEPSQLFADIMVDVQDTEEALNIYKRVNDKNPIKLSNNETNYDSLNNWSFTLSPKWQNGYIELLVYNGKEFVGKGKLLYNKELTNLPDIQSSIRPNVEDVLMDNKWRGTGNSTGMYNVFNDAVKKLTGKPLQSSPIGLSEKATNVWDSLVRKGLATLENTTYTYKSDNDVDLNGEPKWSSIRDLHLSKKVSIEGDVELFQNLVDNGYLNCE